MIVTTTKCCWTTDVSDWAQSTLYSTWLPIYLYCWYACIYFVSIDCWPNLIKPIHCLKHLFSAKVESLQEERRPRVWQTTLNCRPEGCRRSDTDTFPPLLRPNCYTPTLLSSFPFFFPFREIVCCLLASSKKVFQPIENMRHVCMKLGSVSSCLTRW